MATSNMAFAATMQQLNRKKRRSDKDATDTATDSCDQSEILKDRNASKEEVSSALASKTALKNRNYHDFSRLGAVSSDSASAGLDLGSLLEPGKGDELALRLRAMKLPAKLNIVLSNPEFEHIITWLPHGRSWKILDSQQFVQKVMPLFPGIRNMNLFIRLVCSWGFRKITKGPDKDSYYHELFLRGMVNLHDLIQRVTPSDRTTSIDSDEDEPNLYEFSPLPSSKGLSCAPVNGSQDLQLVKQLLLKSKSDKLAAALGCSPNHKVNSLLRPFMANQVQNHIVNPLSAGHRDFAGSSILSPLLAVDPLISASAVTSRQQHLRQQIVQNTLLRLRAAEMLSGKRLMAHQTVAAARAKSAVAQHPVIPNSIGSRRTQIPMWSQTTMHLPQNESQRNIEATKLNKSNESERVVETARETEKEPETETETEPKRSGETKRRNRKNWLPPLGPPSCSKDTLPYLPASVRKQTQDDRGSWMTDNPEAFASCMTPSGK